jgi:DNA polymerase-3 subunit delta'
LAHAYLFAGNDLQALELAGRCLAKALNCQSPPQRSASGLPLDCCDHCPACRKIDSDAHPDVLWIRPESKLRIITIEQMRALMQTVHLKPTVSAWKVALLVAADRLNTQGANAFLKTLEEPPADSIFVLLSTEPSRMLETIRSRCLRLNFTGESAHHRDPATLDWLAKLVPLASHAQKTLLGRYQLLSLILSRLAQAKAAITETLTQESPLERFDDLEPKMREKLEDELEAAIEAEYRRQRTDLLCAVQWWLRDVWLATLGVGTEFQTYPHVADGTRLVAQRLTAQDALENLSTLERTQRLLASNVQEALTLEVGLLGLKL